VGNVPPRSVEVISQTCYTYDYKIGINKYPGNDGEIRVMYHQEAEKLLLRIYRRGARFQPNLVDI
jgi:hypothetical protein